MLSTERLRVNRLFLTWQGEDEGVHCSSCVSSTRLNYEKYQESCMDLSRFPRRQYTVGPSPIEFLPNFTKALGGPKVWIKRDDMLGLAPGGNKTRKLEFLMGDALAKGADTLITCGAPQSNHWLVFQKQWSPFQTRCLFRQRIQLTTPLRD
jgi:hypothetical protein